jgi:hypothetical protein
MITKKNGKNAKSKKTVVSQLERFEEHNTLRLQPVQWEPTPVLSGKARYTANAAVANVTMTINDLLTLPGIMAVTSILAYPVAVAVRLRRARVWGFVATAGTPVLVKLQKAGVDSAGNDFNDSFRTINDSSNSFDRPAFIEMNFDKYSPSGSFHTTSNTNGNVLFLTCPSGAVVDFDYSFVPATNTSAPTITNVIVGQSVGTSGRNKIVSSLLTPSGVNSLN